MRRVAKKRAATRVVFNPTGQEYRTFQVAYDFFNRELFLGKLPRVLLTLQRKSRTRGYFSPERFQGRQESATTAHELALNPDAFIGRTDEQIASVLVHEMVHVWQHAFGHPGRGRYHNREWADKMKTLGLFPSATEEVGGRETGDRMSHYIVPGGVFTRAFNKPQAGEFRLNWQSRPIDVGEDKKRQTRAKFSCPECGLNAWAKPDAWLVCGGCKKRMLAAKAEEAA